MRRCGFCAEKMFEAKSEEMMLPRITFPVCLNIITYCRAFPFFADRRRQRVNTAAQCIDPMFTHFSIKHEQHLHVLRIDICTSSRNVYRVGVGLVVHRTSSLHVMRPWLSPEFTGVDIIIRSFWVFALSEFLVYVQQHALHRHGHNIEAVEVDDRPQSMRADVVTTTHNEQSRLNTNQHTSTRSIQTFNTLKPHTIKSTTMSAPSTPQQQPAPSSQPDTPTPHHQHSPTPTPNGPASSAPS